MNHFLTRRQVKVWALTLILSLTFQFLLPAVEVFAGTGPTQPEAMQFEPLETTDLVNLATGDFTYNLPLLYLPGAEGGYPINLSYHAGIGLNQEATWVGLGWSLNPGAINRVVSGYPDDYNHANVQTDFHADAIRVYGIGLSIGYGPVGVNMNYTSQSGFGMSLILKATTPLSIGHGKFTGDIGFQYSHSIYGEKQESFGVDGDISGLPKIGFDFDLVRGHYSADLSANGLGFSLSSNSSGGTFSISGGSMSSFSEAGKGTTTIFSISLPLFFSPNGWWAGLSYSEYNWRLDETNTEFAYGYLNQGTYFSDPSGNNKYERQQAGNNLFSSQDVYTASGQGMTGSIQPLLKYPYQHIDYSGKDDKAKLTNEFEGYSFTQNNNVSAHSNFRFLEDAGNYYVTDRENAVAWGRDYHYDFPTNNESTFSGKKTTPVFDAKKRIIGFTVKEIDGKIYEYLRPVWNEFTYSRTNVKGDVNAYSYSSFAEPYVVSWLLSGIKGPDYLDVNSNGVCDNEDWGYWIKINYKPSDNLDIWRAPYNGSAPSQTSPNIESWTIGKKDNYLVESIESNTHLAKFNKLPRKDNIPPTDLSGIFLHPAKTAFNSLRPRVYYNGNWINFLKQNFENTTKTIVSFYWSYTATSTTARDSDNQYYYNFNSLPCTGGLTYWKNESISYKYADVKDHIYYDQFNNVTVIEAPYPIDNTKQSNSSCTFYKYNSSTGNNEQKELTITDVTHSLNTYSLNASGMSLRDFFVSKNSVSEKLDNISIYKKDDPALLWNGNEWVVNSGAKVVNSTKFNYSYRLAPNTPSSRSSKTEGDAENKAKLTLESVEFRGLDNEKISPPVKFGYAFNPSYTENDWDNWGAYRDPEAVSGKFEHITSQNKSIADKASAWSLTKIETPLGGKIEVQYESDDYYFVNKTHDLSKSAKYPVENNQAANIDKPYGKAYTSNYLTINAVTDDIKVGDNVYLYHELPERIYGVKHSLSSVNTSTGVNTPGNGIYTFKLPGNWVNVIKNYRKDQAMLRPFANGRTGYMVCCTDIPGNSNYYGEGPNSWNLKYIEDWDATMITNTRGEQDLAYLADLTNQNFPWIVEFYASWAIKEMDVQTLKVIGVDKTATTTSITVETPYQKYTADFWDYYLFVSPPQIYGGGIRTKSLSLSSATDKRTTNYSYKLTGGRSSGVTSSLPALYGKSKAINIAANSKYLESYLDHSKSYGRPSPGVIYSKVDVFNVNGSGGLIDGKSTFEFYTSNDFDYEVDETNNILKITDYSGIIGKPKSVTHFEQTPLNEFRPLKKDEFVYTYSTDLNNHGNVIDKEMTAPPSHIGLTQEKYSFNNNGTVKYIDKVFQNWYQVGTTTTQYYYANPNDAESSGMISNESKNFQWDFRTGNVLASATKSSNGKVNVTKSLPAYWKYNDLENKNMLLQNAQINNYVTSSISMGDNLTLKSYLFPYGDLVGSSVTTWKDWGNGIWRQNDTYVATQKGSSFVPFDLWDNLTYNTNEETNPKQWDHISGWRRTSNMTKYDRYSHPIETRGLDGNYMSSIYGYNSSLPIAIVKNARVLPSNQSQPSFVGNEASYLSFESNSQLAFADNDGWSIYDQNMNVFSEDSHTGHYSIKILPKVGTAPEAPPSFGPTKDFKPEKQTGKYILSAWVKTETGYGTQPMGGLIVQTKKDDDVDNNSFPANNSGSYKYNFIDDTNGEWEYVELEVDLGAMVTVANGQTLRIRCYPVNYNTAKYLLIDDIRFYPKDAGMSTFTYDHLTRKVTSITDENNTSVFYEYDKAGRLIRVRDQDKNIVQRNHYHYKNQ